MYKKYANLESRVARLEKQAFLGLFSGPYIDDDELERDVARALEREGGERVTVEMRSPDNISLKMLSGGRLLVFKGYVQDNAHLIRTAAIKNRIVLVFSLDRQSVLNAGKALDFRVYIDLKNGKTSVDPEFNYTLKSLARHS